MAETAKLASIFIIFGLSVFSGVIPCVTVRCLIHKLGTSTKFKRAINILNCFSGGVFFATSVLHLLPEARESMEQALEGYDFSTEYPLTELIMSIGFFMILTFEHIAHSCCSRNGDISKPEGNQMQIETQKQSKRDTLEEDMFSPNEDPARSRMRGLVLLIALSLHMIFDGLAVGLLKDTAAVWELLAALSLHKVLVFFTIGIQTLEILGSMRKTILVIVMFALVSPCGIIIGESITLSDESVAKDISSAILQGVATGTFLYVTFFEILLRELGSGDHDLLKVFMTVFGFALVASTKLLEH